MYETLFEDNYVRELTPLQKVNRIFATKDKLLGSVYRVRNGRETQYAKVPYTSNNCMVWNENLNKLDKRKIDLTWYIREIERLLF